MSENNLLDTNYIPRELFDVHIQNIRVIASETNGKIDVLDEKLEHLKVVLEEKIEHVTDTLTVAINDTNTRISDGFLRWVIIIGVIQVALTVFLHYWG